MRWVEEIGIIEVVADSLCFENACRRKISILLVLKHIWLIKGCRWSKVGFCSTSEGLGRRKKQEFMDRKWSIHFWNVSTPHSVGARKRNSEWIWDCRGGINMSEVNIIVCAGYIDTTQFLKWF